MIFSETHNKIFNSKKGAYSIVTNDEHRSSQITLDEEEKEVVANYFGSENILIGKASANSEMASKEFLVYPKMERIKLNLVYPKKDNNELRLYLSAESGFKPSGGDVWFVYINNVDQIVIGSFLENKWNTICENINSTEQDSLQLNINEFISIANSQITGKGTTKEASEFINRNKKSYNGLNIDISFGKGRATPVPWIAYLGYDQKVKNGIYPVFLYYKNCNLLILSYGVSESEMPKKHWGINSDSITIETYFIQKSLGRPEKFGNSFVYKVYNTQEAINEEEIKEDLDNLISIYNQTFSFPIPQGMQNIKKEKFSRDEFAEYAKNAGLIFSDEDKLITRFISSLLSKPFVILTGLSGSGKTKLVQAFAQWICQHEDQYCLLPVGADWTNREPLLGYPNALNPDEYIKPEALDLIIKAKENSKLPYFLILDEMNLSHVERYFADFLSVMESKTEISLYTGKEIEGINSKLRLPDNLFIVGTVNIDETTYMFSPKVLDRANVIEFRIKGKDIRAFLEEYKTLNMANLKSKGISMAESFLEMSKITEFEKPVNTITGTLAVFFDELKKNGAEFGYRSASEIIRLINQLGVIDQSLSVDNKIDIAIMQKLLPKLHGSRNKLRKVLIKLGEFCVDETKISDVESLVFNVDEFEFKEENGVKYPISLEKISLMYNRVIENGFTSYAEA
ncbi:MrcB family domain-containing protein [Parabacteroides sp. FAFU027]|uniref:MrcB family domain-containing protein n=1 Tax=Parabacteroides sp. FAFU027 TaxID=2922715 RepID=UPI001FAFFFFD|nr:DUF3578 domain-containing protein [Parabacteroides sp. FAFU027]